MKDKTEKRHVTKMEIKEHFLDRMRERKRQRGIIISKTLDEALEFAFKEENALRWL